MASVLFFLELCQALSRFYHQLLWATWYTSLWSLFWKYLKLGLKLCGSSNFTNGLFWEDDQLMWQDSLSPQRKSTALVVVTIYIGLAFESFVQQKQKRYVEGGPNSRDMVNLTCSGWSDQAFHYLGFCIMVVLYVGCHVFGLDMPYLWWGRLS